MPADFNFYINRQGARGRQGVKGEPGFSPVVTVNTNTAEAYILNIETESGVLTTPNLKSTPLNYIAGAGNYVMYDPSTQQIYNSNVPDELVLRTDLATVENPGIIQIADSEDIADSATDVAVTPKQLNDAIAGVESEIPTDYVDLTSAQNVSGVKTFTNGLVSTGDVTLNNGRRILLYNPSDTSRTLYIQKSTQDMHIVVSNGNQQVKVLNATDVDGTTVWINNQGQLSARGEDFPDNIDGGVFHTSPLGEYTFNVENIDTDSITPVIAEEGSEGVSTGTITLYDRATVKCSITLYINDDYTIDRSGYVYSEYDYQTGRWISKAIAGLENFLTLETTTATAAECTFSIDWDTHVITITGNI
jgi:hypothetical protein